ncbi:MAG: hypothetical protein ABR974_02570 [Bacteroidales bacterium]
MKKLDEIPKNNPFRVPENYFGNLTDRIISHTSETGPAHEKKGTVRKLKPFLLAAASVAILAIIGYTAIYFADRSPDRSLTENIAESRFDNIYLNDIDMATLEENVAGNENFIEIPDLSRNEIIDYLLAEDINVLDIYEQL